MLSAPDAPPKPSGGRHKILVVTGDVIGPGMAGPAIRAWNIAACLAGEHDVVLATTSGRCAGEGEGFEVAAPDPRGFERLATWCDILVVQGYVLLHVPALKREDRILVVDVYDILHLEALELSRRAVDGSWAAHVGVSLDVLNEQAALGDFFLCASEKQRDYWIGHLSACGRVNAATYAADPLLRSLLDVAPFGLPPGVPARTGDGPRALVPGVAPGDELVLWAGGIYDWLDPLTLVRAVDRLRRRRPGLRLVFMGTRHPNPEVPEMAMAREARALARSLGVAGTHVFFNEGWVDYGDRQNWLLDADLGVSTHFDHAETAFAFRTRLLDYLWAGLPVVATGGDAFAQLIEEEGLGGVVAPEDPDALATAIDGLLGDPERRETCRTNVQRVRRRFEWPTALEPLLAFCRAPAHAPDRPAATGSVVEGAPPAGHLEKLRRSTRTAARLYAAGGTQAVVAGAARRLRRAGRRRLPAAASASPSEPASR